MTSFLQLHLLTTYPPSNLNRDDTGRPKTAVFGGVDRLRVSSQSLKRAWRTSDAFTESLEGHMGKRTQRIGKKVLEHLRNAQMDEDTALSVSKKIAEIFGKVAKADKKGAKKKTKQDAKKDASSKPQQEETEKSVLIKQLAFIGPEEYSAAFKLADRALAGEDPEIIFKDVDVLTKSDSAVDIAMFGRMLASDPSYNREAAVQVAHAITTHKVTVEDDYYTAVDDLKEAAEDSGAGFIGVQEFAAGVFYIYMCVNEDLLIGNLGDRADIAGDGLGALVRAAAQVVPKGKQASFASRAYAEFILAERGTRQPRSLAAAFLKPVGVSEKGGDLMAASISRIKQFRDSMNEVYGDCVEASAEMNRIAAIESDADKAGSLDEMIDFATSYARAWKN